MGNYLVSASTVIRLLLLCLTPLTKGMRQSFLCGTYHPLRTAAPGTFILVLYRYVPCGDQLAHNAKIFFQT